MKKSSWARGEFSDELSGAEASKNMMAEAVGKTIVCDDGIPRRVVEICYSKRWPWMAIINEQDEQSNAGHFVHLLSLAAQIIGKPIPTPDVMEAFNNAVKVKHNVRDDGTYDRPPEKSRIIVPFFRGK